jgi:hypothetical protein
MSKSAAELLMFGSLAVLGLMLSRPGNDWNLSALALAVASLVMFGYTLYKRQRGSTTDDPE